VEVIYRIVFYKEAQKDIEYWQKSGNKQAIKKISDIVEALKATSQQKPRRS